MENIKALNDDAMEQAVGGDSLRDDPLYNAVKELYKEKGVRTAGAWAKHYYGDDKAMAMIKMIGEELEQGAEQPTENNFNF